MHDKDVSNAALTAIVLDCSHAAPLARFWAMALGWSVRPYDQAEIQRLAGLGFTPDTDPTGAVDSPDGSLTLFCVEVPEPKTGKNRMHLDLTLDRERFAELVAMGATVIKRMPEWTVMGDQRQRVLRVLNRKSRECFDGDPRRWRTPIIAEGAGSPS
jgi:hypothetical protein